MSEFRLQLARAVADDGEFKAAYRELQWHSLSSLFRQRRKIDGKKAQKLLQSALIFAQSTDKQLHVVAQDIAYCLAALRLSDEAKAACGHVMATLGNFPASKFIAGGSGSIRFLPWQLAGSETARRDANSIRVRDELVLLTDFQLTVWRELHKRQFVSVSAPTSSGKSFIIQTFLKDYITRSDRNLDVVYIVPSRSLIHEVQAKLTDALPEVVVMSTPRARIENAFNQTRVFVFTQERLRTALDQEDFDLDILIVDEAQQIGDGARGILLHSCLEDAIRRIPSAKVLLITPGRQSGAPIGDLLQLDGLADLQTHLRPVRQNIIYADFVQARKDDHLQLSLQLPEGGRLELGKIVAQPCFNNFERLIETIRLVGSGSKSLVYASSKAPAEATATALAGLDDPLENVDAELRELARFIRHHVHPDFVLADCVERGVGFHYGNMPTNITKAVEDSFADGAIDTLVCTSTLLQGVNLPARNIFIFNPHKGKNTPMGVDDFWNLAGRAGRLSKDTHGNVFLVSYDQWKSQPVLEAPALGVVPALAKALTSEQRPIVTFAENTKHASGNKRTAFAESVFARLFIDAKSGTLLQTIKMAAPSHDLRSMSRLIRAIEQHLDSVTLPVSLLKRHGMISPLRQQEMFTVLRAAVAAGHHEAYMPLHPMGGDEAKQRLEFILQLIHEHFEGRRNEAHRFYGWFALSWMEGTSLKDMIDGQLRYARERATKAGQKRSVSSGDVIKRVLQEIEEKLRFKYVKFISCYLDLLKHAIVVEGGEPADFLPIPLFLELGACSRTMVSCMDLGLSRIAAREVMEQLQGRELNSVVVRLRLRNLPDWRLSKLSPLVVQELKRLNLR
ncbi:DEAD/DEAH box helicase [Paraburkholderia tropica]|uniref:DEAD/DEAH box helicase n=1 Tax=Paraburkholderia tropica TaxID=92647 RepID=UPI002ABD9B20|nr:DEAD/DEAH box helicase [Paraburkholderia tropica]